MSKQKEKAHDDIDITYFPKHLRMLQEELMHPYHVGLWVRLDTKHRDELAEAKFKNDYMEFMVIIATEIGMLLEGNYTIDQVAEMLYNEISKVRRVASIEYIARKHEEETRH